MNPVIFDGLPGSRIDLPAVDAMLRLIGGAIVEYRLLGRTGLKVSKYSLGTMTFGDNQWGLGGLDAQAAREMVAASLDVGINFFDTADIYANGESESLLGQALGSRRRDVVIATKVRAQTGDGPNDCGLSRHHILDAVHRSLKRLGTDYIDLYQVHGWDNLTPLDETLRALDDLVRRGDVRYIGASNFASWQLTKSLWSADKNGWTRFETLQPYYNLLSRDIEHELVPLCVDQQIGILVWSPLAGGWLSGKYRAGKPLPQGVRLNGPMGEFLPVVKEKVFRVVDLLIALGEGYDASPAAVALAWLAQKEAVTSVIIGARNMRQLQDNLRASDIQLTTDDMSTLNDISRSPQPYPQWMIDLMQQDRT